jgi:hypothetical protein
VDALLAAQRESLDRFWAGTEVVVECGYSPVRLQQAISWNLFQLAQATCIVAAEIGEGAAADRDFDFALTMDLADVAGKASAGAAGAVVRLIPARGGPRRRYSRAIVRWRPRRRRRACGARCSPAEEGEGDGDVEVAGRAQGPDPLGAAAHRRGRRGRRVPRRPPGP